MQFVTVRSFDLVIPAQLLKGQLEDAGFHPFLADEFTVYIDPILTNAVGGIKLQVPETELPEVSRWLEAYDEAYRQAARCPKCAQAGMDLMPARSLSNRVSAILSWFFSSYAVNAEQVYRCPNCGFETTELPSPEDFSTNDAAT
ncbi:MAG TPA: hypothetical protein PKK69_00180 [Ferruginibacter sp.]|nr:hypothetical protein [Ferruginibacter sp.]